MNNEIKNQILDEDGENLAVRAFLMRYSGIERISVGGMRRHMGSMGFPHWPDWVGSEEGYLTKGGAQDWLRYLFALEAQPASAGLTQKRVHEAMLAAGFHVDYNKRTGVHTYTGFIEQAEDLLSAAQRDSQPPIVEQLFAALRSVNAVAIERGDKFGVCDQIDNDGQPYQSQHLADLLRLAA